SLFLNVALLLSDLHSFPTRRSCDLEGNMEYGLADMEVYDYISPEFLIKRTHLLIKAKCIIADLNISKNAMDFLCAYSEKHNIKLIIIPVSSPKMKNMPDSLHAID